MLDATHVKSTIHLLAIVKPKTQHFLGWNFNHPNLLSMKTSVFKLANLYKFKMIDSIQLCSNHAM